MSQQTQQIDQETLECITKTKSLCKCFGTIFIAFLFAFLILCPSIIEIVVVTQLPKDLKYIVVLACGCFTTLIAIIGGFKLGSSIPECYKNKCNDCCCGKNNCKFWCGTTKDVPDYSSILSPGYIIYSLPQWVVTNMITSWALLGDGIILHFYVNLMIYMPLLMYPIFIFVGWAYEKATESDYTTI